MLKIEGTQPEADFTRLMGKIPDTLSIGRILYEDRSKTNSSTTRAASWVFAQGRERNRRGAMSVIAGLVSSLRRFGPAKNSVSCHNLAVLRLGSQFMHPSDVPFPIFQDPAMCFAQEKSPLLNLGSLALLVCSLGILASGCSKPTFEPNKLAAASFLESQDPQKVHDLAGSVSELVEAVFGPPDAPKWPEGAPSAVDMAEVERCAGPVGRAYDKVERGLYRKHCVQCHGITGDGAGPAASLLAPYPRDFRRGTFKFKSTNIGSKPLRSDLVKVIEHGLPGTSMPAFGALRNRPEFKNDIESLAEYVVFLAVRGEVERRLLKRAVDSEETPNMEDALRVASSVAESWVNAPSNIIEIPVIPELSFAEHAASIERGKALFTSDKASCFKCHGPDGRGDGVSQDFDEWTKDWTIRVGIDPAKKSEWKVMKPFGALKPVVDRSRNFSLGGLRGGSTEQDIVKRIILGVDGTPMPAATLSETDPNAFSLENVFDLARYVASLSATPAESNSTAIDSAKGAQ